MPRLTQLIEHHSEKIAVPALRIVGNILSSNDLDIAQVAVNAGVLGLFACLIDHPKQIMRKECAWSLANVTAESPERVQACLDGGIIESLILHMQHDVAMVKRECIWAMTNALCKATPQ